MLDHLEFAVMLEEEIFSAALERTDPAERAAFLDRACAEPALRSRIEALLRSHEGAGDFLAAPLAVAPLHGGTEARGGDTGEFFAGLAAGAGPGVAEDVGACIGPYKLLQKI